MSLILALFLSLTAFARVYFTHGKLTYSLVITLTLFSIVLLSGILASILPVVLQKLKVDPAFAAGPFLATIIDILGIIIYCSINRLILA
jgi:magnesium transporter